MLTRENFESAQMWDRLVCLVDLASLMQPNKPDMPNKPNELVELANYFSIPLRLRSWDIQGELA